MLEIVGRPVIKDRLLVRPHPRGAGVEAEHVIDGGGVTAFGRINTGCRLRDLEIIDELRSAEVGADAGFFHCPDYGEDGIQCTSEISMVTAGVRPDRRTAHT